MSVYYEAIKSGRLTPEMIREAGSQPRALRRVKSAEADARNAKTPYERTARYRRGVR